eukprot:2654981-Pyramimonas_sp.AAC.3
MGTAYMHPLEVVTLLSGSHTDSSLSLPSASIASVGEKSRCGLPKLLPTPPDLPYTIPYTIPYTMPYAM